MNNFLIDGLYDMLLQQAVPKSSEYNKAVKRAADMQEKLIALLNNEQKELLDKYERLEFDYKRLEEIQMISMAFSLAFKIFDEGVI